MCNSMSDLISVPMSACPLHLGHEEFLENLSIYGKINVSLQGGDNTLEKLNEKIVSNQSKEYRKKVFDLISIIDNQNDFLTIEQRKKIIKKGYKQDIIVDNKGLSNIKLEEYLGISIGSDIILKLLNSEHIDKKFKKFDNLYIFERIGFELPRGYEKLLKNKGIKSNIIYIGKSTSNISGTNIRKEYSKYGIVGIEQFVSKEVYNIIKTMKS